MLILSKYSIRNNERDISEVGLRIRLFIFDIIGEDKIKEGVFL